MTAPTTIGVTGALSATVSEFGCNANLSALKVAVSTNPFEAETLV